MGRPAQEGHLGAHGHRRRNIPKRSGRRALHGSEVLSPLLLLSQVIGRQLALEAEVTAFIKTWGL